MQREFLLLAIFALAIAVALPTNNMSVEVKSETVKTGLQKHCKTRTKVHVESEIGETKVKKLSNTITTEDVSQELEQELPSTTTTEKPESKVINIESSGDFETRLTQAGDKLVVLFVMTSWCYWSRVAVPIVESIAANTEDLVVLQIDVDKVKNTPDIDWKYGVTDVESVPVISFVRSGVMLEEDVDRTGGLKGMRQALAKYIPSFGNDSDNNA